MTRKTLIATIILAPVVIAVLLVGGAYLFLQTDSGRALLVSEIESAVNDPDGLTIELGSLEGNILGDFSIVNVRLRDAQGEWLRIEDIQGSWSPFELLSGTLDINAITAARLELDRQPVLPPSEEETESAPGLPALPVNIRLSRFEIAEIIIAEPVVGQAADLSLLVNLNAKIDDVIHSEIRLSEQGSDGGLNGSVDFDPAKETLAVDVRLEEPEGGLISRLLALPGYPAITASIVGEGSLNGWSGQLEASAGRIFEADFAIKTEGGEKIRIDLDGGAALDQSLAADIPLVDDSRISIAAALVYDTETTEVTLTSADVENAVLQVSASGTVNPADEAVKLSLTTTLRDTAEVNKLMAPAAISGGTITLDLDGTFDAMTANALVKATELDIEDSLAAREVTGTFTSKLDLADMEVIPLKGSAALVNLSKLPPEAVSLIGENLDIDFELTYALESQKLDLTTLRLLGAHVMAEGAGALNIADLSAEADVALTLDDLSRALPMGGKLVADLSLTSPDISQTMSGTLKARTEQFDMQDASLQPLVGSAPTLDVKIDMANEKLTFTDILLAVASGEVTGQVALPMSFETIEADLTAKMPALAPLSDIATIPIKGNAVLQATLSGALADPDIDGRLDVANLDVDGMALGALDAEVKVQALATSPDGKISLRLRHDKLTALAAADFALPDYGRLDLTNLNVTEQDNKIAGDLTVPFDGSPLTGEVKATIPDLATVAALAGETAAGSLDLAATLADQGGEQAINATVNGKALQLESADVALETLTAKASMTGAFDAPALEATAEIANIRLAAQELKSVSASVNGGFKDLDYRIALTRGAEPELELTGSGNLKLGDTATEIRLAALDGAFAGRKIALTQPLALTLEGEDITLDTFVLAFGEGEMQASGSLTSAAARAKLDFSNLPVDMVALVDPAYEMSGGLNGGATLSVEKGTPATGTLTLKATEVRLTGEEYAELPAFASTVTADLKDGELAVTGDVTGLEATTIDITGRLPFDLSLDPFNIRIDEDKPVNAKLDIDSELKKIWPLLAMDTQKMSGQLTADATVTGTINAPEINGNLRLADGYFEEIEQGTILKNISIKADIANSEVLTIETSAVDNQGGTVKSSGTVNFETLTDPRVDVTTTMAGLLAVNRDDITVITDGDIIVKGETSNLYVEGSVTTREVEINIGGSVAPNIVDLQYEVVNRPGAPEKKEETVATQSTINLDFDLHLPGRVFIRGRGLDSEWQGNFIVRGTAAQPRIEGQISPVRGQFTFAGKSFKLQEGEIALVGGETINPELSLKARYDGPNVTAIVTISGTASNPKISFTSPDGLPQDEVLSHVLFGKSSGKLSALEAVQLAETIATLSGKLGGGGGITGFARETLGVDVISASTNEETGAAEVSVGKYVTDNVYVGVDQGAGSGSTRAKVQIELTPNISVESEVGQSTDSSVGIFWKWDY